MTAESFILTFLHKNSENPLNSKTFYAFTFPYTYTEQQEQLEAYDEAFGKDEIAMDLFIQDVKGQQLRSKQVTKLTTGNSPPKTVQPEIVIEERLTSTTDPNNFSVYGNDTLVSSPQASSLEYLKHNFEIKTTRELLQQQYQSLIFSSNLDCKNAATPTVPHAPAETVQMAVDENTSESMQQITDLVHNVKIELQRKSEMEERPIDLRDEIYYHRELLIRSYEGRRIDLLTISSFHGITDQREERISTLFPELTCRCYVFKEKKIIFVSSRVHPGETPASFVLNGFLQLLLDRKSTVAQTLR